LAMPIGSDPVESSASKSSPSCLHELLVLWISGMYSYLYRFAVRAINRDARATFPTVGARPERQQS
jgi:hypothetical protein